MARKPTPKKKTAASARGVSAASVEQAEPLDREPGRFPVVGIGASAGGLEAFKQLLEALPPDTGMAFVLVPHLAAHHESMLSQILGRRSPVPVMQVEDGMRVRPNTAFVIAPGTDMVIEQGALRLSPRPQRAQSRSINRFFASLAADLHHQAIGVVLSGTADDGTVGLEEIKAAGGVTFAQDDSALQPSMPRSAVASGAVDFVLPPAGIAAEIARIARHPLVAPVSVRGSAAVMQEAEFGHVLDLLRGASEVDFSGYKRTTLLRRIARRMVVHRMPGLAEYLAMLRHSPAEIEALFRDVLISVTSFFRNPESWLALRTVVFPQLVGERSRRDPLRVWIQGCSTGEEAYSMAMALTEYGAESGRTFPFQIFATDVNNAGIEKARSGTYAKDIAEDVSPEQLRKFFVEVDGGYRVTKAIRERCVFAQHNVLAAPPFSHIDLASCRNLLIYLDTAAQRKLMSILHYALKPEGWLWLGQSESVAGFRELFEQVDAKHKIYSRKGPGGRVVLPLQSVPRQPESRVGTAATLPSRGPEPQREADRILLSRFAPASVLVGEDLEVLQFRGDTGRFLSPAPGKATLHLLKLIRPGLLGGVRNALLRARKEGVPVRQPGLVQRTGKGNRLVNVEVVPIGAAGMEARSYLVLFEEADAPAPGPSPRARAARDRALERDEIGRLEKELDATRDYLQSFIEQQEGANEDLQSANEEVQSANEELQSINEELETSKEEIQSSNEELATLNDELQHRNEELTRSNDDLFNVLSSSEMAIVLLDSDYRIRRFTPAAGQRLRLLPADVGRPITDLKLGLTVPSLAPLISEVIDTVHPREQEVRDEEGRWFSLRIRPYRTMDNRIDGAVLMLVDIDVVKLSQEAIQQQFDLLEQTHEPVMMWELDNRRITYWNPAATEAYGFNRSEAVGRTVDELLAPAPVRPDLADVLRREGRWTGELVHFDRNRQPVEVEARMVLVIRDAGSPLILETILPVGERRALERTLRQQADALEAADRSRNEFLGLVAHELRNPLGALRNVAHLLRVPTAVGELDRVQRIMNRQIQNMARMIDDLVDVARVAQGEIELHREPLDLGTVIGRAIDVTGERMEERAQKLTVTPASEAVSVDGDASRLEQVFVNLLSNASRFTNPGGQIWLSTEVVRRPRDTSRARGILGIPHAVVRIRDDGAGIGQAMLPRVFDPFAQAERSPERLEGGLGLGLVVVRRIVALHGGNVEASSAGLGMGSEFVVRLPLAPVMVGGESVIEEQAEPATERRVGPRRVMIVDDEPDTAETMAMLLRGLGHEVRVHSSAESALGAVEMFRPDLAIIDLALPGMDGFALARELTAKPTLRKLRLVAVSGFNRDVLDPDGEQRRIFDFQLDKPVDPDDLREILQGG